MIPEWLQDKTIAVWDIEADWIPSTIIYCIGVSIIKNGEVLSKSKIYTHYWLPGTSGSLVQAINLINSCDFNVGHNIISYDIPTVERILGVSIVSTPLDTLLLSKIIFSKDDLYIMDPNLGLDSDLYGSYSLKAFGQRFGDFKLDFHDFDELTPTMITYCNQDVDLTARLILFLLEKENFPIWPVVDIEHKAAKIIQEQTEMGFYIDIDKTRELNTALLQEKGEIARELSETFHPKWLKDGQEKSYKKLSTIRKFLPDNNYVDPWR